MAFFKTEEEKQQIAAAKEHKLLAKYGLDTLTNPKDIESVRRISNELLGSGMMEAGMRLSMGAKTEDQLQVTYQRTIMEQNFLIIRKLCEISEALKK